MIKFFRKIRQNLLSEGKTGKYLKYAIGEIVLVVIGILIALQLNSWKEEIKAKEEERLKKEKERASTKRRSTGSGYKRQNPVVKVLTSATFIRGAMGVLMKMFKK